MSYLSRVLNTPTPQTEALDSTQVPNSAGGFSWAVDNWVRMERFLILGSEGGSYYAGERALTLANAKAVEACIKEDGIRALGVILNISEEGRAPKNGPALFALAIAFAQGDETTRRYAKAVLPGVARTASHLFEFVSYVSAMRGWGRGLRSAISYWYLSRDTTQLAYQAIKYRNRNGYTHADLLRLAHPKTGDTERNALFKWMVDGWDDIGEDAPTNGLRLVWAYEKAQKASAKEIVALIRDYNLPREAIPTEHLNDANVWSALLEKMPMTAMVRNLGKMTSVGILGPLSDGAKRVAEELHNVERIRASRLHPLALLVALNTYGLGAGIKGSLTWTPNQLVKDSLNDAFYLAFGNIVPTGKRWLLALDVSGSMTGGQIAGMPGITPRVGSVAMAMATARTEQQYHFMGFSTTFIPLDVTAKMDLQTAMKRVAGLPFAGTDCSLPMEWAIKNKVPVDAFAVYTDNETYVGKRHPAAALRDYRQKLGIDAKLIVVGMVANQFTIADPTDAGMLDVVGFSTSAPAVMSEFVAPGAGAINGQEDTSEA